MLFDRCVQLLEGLRQPPRWVQIRPSRWYPAKLTQTPGRLSFGISSRGPTSRRTPAPVSGRQPQLRTAALILGGSDDQIDLACLDRVLSVPPVPSPKPPCHKDRTCQVVAQGWVDVA